MSIKRIFFDLDGTLVNSDRLFWQANFEVLNELKIKVKKKDVWKRYVTESYGLTDILKGLGYSSTDIKRSKDRRREIYLDLLEENVEYLPHVLQTLKSLKKKGVSLWIVTTNSNEFISMINKKLKLDTYFEHIISRKNIKKGKPNPEIYIFAIKESKTLKKEQCIAIEDTPKGVYAAHNAGLKCIFIPNKNSCISLDECNFIENNVKYVLIEDIDNLYDMC